MARKTKNKERTRQKQPAQPPDNRPFPARGPSARAAFFQDLALQVLVFNAGAVLMALEIAGSRVLAPHFGNSVFVWGSLISVVLMALSLGYYLGGLVADRFPSRVLLNSICAAVSVLIFAVAISSNGICAFLAGNGFGEQSGPLISSLLLFLPAGVGMGMVSPFAVRLATHSVSSVGRSAGTLYALSTMGSIAGTLLTTFLLIPLLGLVAILKGLALVLLLTAVLTLPYRKSVDTLLALALFLAVALACVLWPAELRTLLRPGDRVVLDVDTPYHHISVVDNGGMREMRFDRYVESAILMTPPHRSLAPYTDGFHLSFLAQPEIGRSLFVGAGGGVGPRAFHMHDHEMLIDVVDIDPKVLDVAKSHFFLEHVPQIRTIAEDGRMFVRKTPDKYDCIVLDAFTIGGRIPFHLVTRDFFGLCRDRMTEEGVFVMNINSAVEGPLAGIFHSMVRTLDSVFPNMYAFAMGHRQAGTSRSMNIILVATKNTPRISPQEWTARAKLHQSDSYIENRRMLGMVADLLVDLPDVSQAPIFTDDYAPIETMPF